LTTNDDDAEAAELLAEAVEAGHRERHEAAAHEFGELLAGIERPGIRNGRMTTEVGERLAREAERKTR
jgi:hypothetical protein